MFTIAGNGPSGLGLSYMLAGHWPYYNGQPHPDDMLTARLHSAPAGRSVLHQDLKFLSQVRVASSKAVSLCYILWEYI